MRAHVVAAGLALVLGAGACGSTADGEGEGVALEQDSPRPAESEPAPGGSDAGPDGGDKGSRDDVKGDPREKDTGAPGGRGPGGGRDDAPREEGGDGGGGDRPTGERTPGDGGSRSRGKGALAPAAGSYVYSQSGFEEFCAAGCDRQPLPKRQVIETTVPQRSAARATVVTEAKASNSRMARTTTRYTRAGAFVTQVYVRFSYAGYSFERTYRPQPEVESLRFPLTPGASWSGTWEGKVSGSYSMSVVGRETTTVSGRAVKTFKVETSTRFRGDFDGRAHATLWIDPRTKALVKTAGNLNVESAYGRYATGFATTLSSGPGY